ncbi:alcohol dehydrogenase family protein [Vibrio sp. LaRot3]|uniref:alcohol dehydrogenase family protein n=1 Tax=Vibrio sp. LaRot3 TaxID=2998829 RepID=UPI0022CE2291|nr:alcohol dehydrogenase family protein [Vibrio sp. LaRot3]MDA0149825.1 alcohol dehydrogenase family protein [Vibrio sp. LaRot3]
MRKSNVLLTAHGEPEVLQYSEEIPLPTAQAHQVLIKVLAAGVNNTDINTRTGWYSKGNNDSKDAGWAGNALTLPRIQGADVCGEIVAVGSNVDASRLGERVIIEPCLNQFNGEPLSSTWYFGSECDGGFAQFTVVDGIYAHKVNSDMSAVELASFPCSYSTAENMLTRSNVQSCDTVLVTGASGGVGSAAIQLAKARGAKVIAITSAGKVSQLKQLGVDEVVLRDADLVKTLGSNSIDVVIDLVAGSQWPLLLEVLKPHGRYAVSGAIGGPIVELDVRTLYLKDLSFFGCTHLEPQVFPNLVKRIEAKQIQPLVAKTFALKEIAKAQAMFLEKGHVGKIVLVP